MTDERQYIGGSNYIFKFVPPKSRSEIVAIEVSKLGNYVKTYIYFVYRVIPTLKIPSTKTKYRI